MTFLMIFATESICLKKASVQFSFIYTAPSRNKRHLKAYNTFVEQNM